MGHASQLWSLSFGLLELGVETYLPGSCPTPNTVRKWPLQKLRGGLMPCGLCHLPSISDSIQINYFKWNAVTHFTTTILRAVPTFQSLDSRASLRLKTTTTKFILSKPSVWIMPQKSGWTVPYIYGFPCIVSWGILQRTLPLVESCKLINSKCFKIFPFPYELCVCT